MSIYCTYLTTYKGNKLPMFYIGSTKTDNITKNNYKGSVSSKKYSLLWGKELKENPHLFVTKIISYHKTDEEAREMELLFHRALNVVKSPLYVNMSEARVNGFFGRDVSGKNNPRYGSTWGDSHPKGMLGKRHSEKTKKEWSRKRKNSIPWNKGIKNKKQSEYMKTFMKGNSYAKGIKYPKCSCLICKKEVSSNTIKRHLSLHD